VGELDTLLVSRLVRRYFYASRAGGKWGNISVLTSFGKFFCPCWYGMVLLPPLGLSSYSTPTRMFSWLDRACSKASFHSTMAYPAFQKRRAPTGFMIHHNEVPADRLRKRQQKWAEKYRVRCLKRP